MFDPDAGMPPFERLTTWAVGECQRTAGHRSIRIPLIKGIQLNRWSRRGSPCLFQSGCESSSRTWDK